MQFLISAPYDLRNMENSSVSCYSSFPVTWEFVEPSSAWLIHYIVLVPSLFLGSSSVIAEYGEPSSLGVPWNMLNMVNSVPCFSYFGVPSHMLDVVNSRFKFLFLPSSLEVSWDMLNMVNSVPSKFLGLSSTW